VRSAWYVVREKNNEKPTMKFIKAILLVACISGLSPVLCARAEEAKPVFSTVEEKDKFAKNISSAIEKAWKAWQKEVRVDNVYVDGSRGVLIAGDWREPVITLSSIMNEFDVKGVSQDHIDCARAVAGTVENGMRLWQRGYSHNNIPFPQGASCVYTLPPTYNIPVTVASGTSAGDAAMTEESLYNYMLYRVPNSDENVLSVLHGAASAISECFLVWKRSCLVSDMVAKGGVAPQPSPMGQGPGLVKGAKGNGGRLTGAYFDGERMYERMREYFSKT